MALTLEKTSDQRAEALPPLARLPVLIVAGVTAGLLLFLSGRYGFFGDELYFVAAGGRWSWGYADQPPLVPLWASFADSVAPGSLRVLRIPSIVATSVGVLVSALIAREFGGDRRAQLLSATTHAVAFVGMSTTLATWTLDILVWTVLGWLLVRWVRLHSTGVTDDRPLLWAGVVAAVGLQAKLLVIVFLAALLVSVVLCGPRALLRRRMLWWGTGIALVSAVPTVAWQALHGWPQLEMGEAITAEVHNAGPLINVLDTVRGMGPVVGVFLTCYGWWRLQTSVELRRFRFFGVAALLVVAFFLIVGGRPYYDYGVFPVLWAAGAVGFQHRRKRRYAHAARAPRWPLVPVFALSLPLLAIQLPVEPTEEFVSKPVNPIKYMFVCEIGWSRIADPVASVYRELTPEQQRNTTLVASNYWLASALEYYGPRHGLPEVYSGSRGYWYFGAPPDSATTVLYVGKLSEPMRRNFGSVRQVASLYDGGLRIESWYEGRPVYLVTEPRASWSRIWPEFREIKVADIEG